jgi:hypothetical protein
MGEIHVSAIGTVGASPERIYSYLADYRQHHPNILPPAFSDLRVEEGGIGAGTVVSFAIKAGGRLRHYRVRVTEPEPGRLLQEADEHSSLVTSFAVQPDGSGSRVEISSRWQGASGFGGFMERLFAPRVLRSLYADELARLDRYAREKEHS